MVKKSISLMLMLGLMAASSVSASTCDLTELCDMATEARQFHIPYVRGAANNVSCPGNYADDAALFVDAAAAPIKNAETELCSSSPDLANALAELNTARNLLRSAYNYYRFAISIDGCTDPDVYTARDRAYDAWRHVDYMHFIVKYDCP